MQDLLFQDLSYSTTYIYIFKYIQNLKKCVLWFIQPCDWRADLPRPVLAGDLPEPAPWPISGRGRGPSTWITWGARELSGPWPTASNRSWEDTTAATAKTRASSAIILARKHPVTAVPVSHLWALRRQRLQPPRLAPSRPRAPQTGCGGSTRPGPRVLCWAAVALPAHTPQRAERRAPGGVASEARHPRACPGHALSRFWTTSPVPCRAPLWWKGTSAPMSILNNRDNS